MELSASEKKLALFIIPLLLGSLLLNLGLRPLFADEPIRAIIALELELNENFIVPTINGEYYYNKPPVYNWILILFSKITGGYSEWSVRLPMIMFLIVFGYTIYQVFKKHIGQKVSFLTALAFITSSRIFFYDSYLGLIDVFYSWVVFLSIWSLFHFGQNRNYYLLFISSYLLTSVGILVKGLPSLVFQGVSLLMYFIYTKQFRKLFSIEHIAGVLTFCIPLLAYFWSYSQYNSLADYFNVLWTESSRRTVVEKDFLESVLHLFTFPFEHILVTLFPWCFLGLVLLSKKVRISIWQVPVLKFCVLMVAANIVIYWLSPETRPRYLFMIYAMILPVLIFAYEKLELKTKYKKMVDAFILALSSLLLLLPLALIYMDKDALNQINYPLYLSISILGIIISLMLYFRTRISKPLILVLVLISVKISFGGIVIPYRFLTEIGDTYKAQTLAVLESTKDKPLWILRNTPIDRDASFYLENERQEIVRRQNEGIAKKDRYYITNEYWLNKYGLTPICTFHVRWENTLLYIAELK